MKWIYSQSDPLLETLLGALILFVVVILLTRLIGLRSFAKFSAYDFAFTVAIGGIISAILTSSTSIIHGSVAIAALLSLTYIFSFLEKKIPALKKVLTNDPLLLMDKGEILYENLAHARIDKEQLVAKLREANVLNYSQVEAVVLETTGDISVLHNSTEGVRERFDESLLEGVRRAA